MKIQHYLQHINNQGYLEPFIKLVGHLQTCHLYSFPYKKVDMAMNKTSHSPFLLYMRN